MVSGRGSVSPQACRRSALHDSRIVGSAPSRHNRCDLGEPYRRPVLKRLSHETVSGCRAGDLWPGFRSLALTRRVSSSD
jgi:hypothetical protein